MIFVVFNHIWSNGGGKGSGVQAAFSLARLHMLSYARITGGMLLVSPVL